MTAVQFEFHKMTHETTSQVNASSETNSSEDTQIYRVSGIKITLTQFPLCE